MQSDPADIFPDIEVHPSDRLFAWIPPDSNGEDIRVNISQHLAEQASKDALPVESLPEHLAEYEDMLSKTSFDRLPNKCPWDHAIELIPGATP